MCEVVPGYPDIDPDPYISQDRYFFHIGALSLWGAAVRFELRACAQGCNGSAVATSMRQQYASVCTIVATVITLGSAMH